MDNKGCSHRYGVNLRPGRDCVLLQVTQPRRVRARLGLYIQEMADLLLCARHKLSPTMLSIVLHRLSCNSN